LLSPIERQEQCDPELVEAVAYALPESMRAQDEAINRSELLKLLAADTVACPFRPITKDENLETEFAEAVGLMDNDALPIINVDAIRKVLEGTELQRAFAETDELHFLDDLFYRGRTLYSLAVVVEAFGGDAKSIRLTSLCCDMKSTNLTSPYHKVLNPSKLYTFENSIRTEQGYWQDVGDRYVFTDMANYWDLLRMQVDGQESLTTYTEWQTKIRTWYEAYVERGATEVDMSLVGPLIWLRVYHDAFGLDMSIEKIVDQKGYRIGACVPFAQLIDRFVSQEEPVEVRSAFKAEIADILNSIQAASLLTPNGYQDLTEFYVQNQRDIDYNGLSFMFEVDTPPQPELSSYSSEYLTMIALLKDHIAFEASNTERPYVVGINGVDTSGKTELTNALEASLRESGVKVSTVHFDTFTNPKSQRHSGLDAVDNYYNHTFDVDSLRRHILEPIAEGQLPKIVLRHVDSRDDSILVEHAYDMPSAPSVVLVEGVFLFRPELQDHFRLKIFVDISTSAMRERAMIRDVPRFGFVALAKLMNKYIPAQERYMHDVMPGNISDIIIDNSNWNMPIITKHKE
jgi:uridine kinase